MPNLIIFGSTGGFIFITLFRTHLGKLSCTIMENSYRSLPSNEALKSILAAYYIIVYM